MTMTPNELAAAARTLFGPHWQSPLARTVDVNDRTVRRWASGDQDVPERVARWLHQQTRRSPWIVGAEPDGAREYVIRQHWPRLIARVADDAGGDDADTVSGITYADAGEVLCEVIWLDDPNPDDVAGILADAARALHAYTWADASLDDEAPV